MKNLLIISALLFLSGCGAYNYKVGECYILQGILMRVSKVRQYGIEVDTKYGQRYFTYRELTWLSLDRCDCPEDNK